MDLDKTIYPSSNTICSSSNSIYSTSDTMLTIPEQLAISLGIDLDFAVDLLNSANNNLEYATQLYFQMNEPTKTDLKPISTEDKISNNNFEDETQLYFQMNEPTKTDLKLISTEDKISDISEDLLTRLLSVVSFQPIHLVLKLALVCKRWHSCLLKSLKSLEFSQCKISHLDKMSHLIALNSHHLQKLILPIGYQISLLPENLTNLEHLGLSNALCSPEDTGLFLEKILKFKQLRILWLNNLSGVSLTFEMILSISRTSLQAIDVTGSHQEMINQSGWPVNVFSLSVNGLSNNLLGIASIPSDYVEMIDHVKQVPIHLVDDAIFRENWTLIKRIKEQKYFDDWDKLSWPQWACLGDELDQKRFSYLMQDKSIVTRSALRILIWISNPHIHPLLLQCACKYDNNDAIKQLLLLVDSEYGQIINSFVMMKDYYTIEKLLAIKSLSQVRWTHNQVRYMDTQYSGSIQSIFEFIFHNDDTTLLKLFMGYLSHEHIVQLKWAYQENQKTHSTQEPSNINNLKHGLNVVHFLCVNNPEFIKKEAQVFEELILKLDDVLLFNVVCDTLKDNFHNNKKFCLRCLDLKSPSLFILQELCLRRWFKFFSGLVYPDKILQNLDRLEVFCDYGLNLQDLTEKQILLAAETEPGLVDFLYQKGYHRAKYIEVLVLQKAYTKLLCDKGSDDVMCVELGLKIDMLKSELITKSELGDSDYYCDDGGYPITSSCEDYSENQG